MKRLFPTPRLNIEYSAAKCVRRSGFTLLETVIAMSLLTLLLGVLWSVFGMFTKYDTKGKRAAAKSALVRSLHRQLRDDLIAAVGIHDRLPQVGSARSDDQSNQWQPPNGYFIGTASQMHFVAHVAHDGEPLVGRGTDFISVAPTNPPTELFRVISYQPRSSSEPDILETGEGVTPANPDVADSAFLDLNVPVDETPLGIDRHVRNWKQYVASRSLVDEELASTFAGRNIVLDSDDFLVIGDENDSTETAANLAERRAPMVDQIPEVRAMFFRYFDGSTWVSNWDSSQRGRLPIAIEIGFDLDMTDPEPPSDPSSSVEIDSGPLDTVDAIIEMEKAAQDSDTIDWNPEGDLTPTWNTEFRWVIALDSILPNRESTSGSLTTVGALP